MLAESVLQADRRGLDRRHRHGYALLTGSFKARRRIVRRGDDHRISSIDWHDSRWFAVAILVMLLSVADALLTLTLINLGAVEINPFMAPLVAGSGHSFAYWKLGLTGLGLMTLILLVRYKVFRGLPVAVLLYLILAAYATLVSYELWLLERLLFLYG